MKLSIDELVAQSIRSYTLKREREEQRLLDWTNLSQQDLGSYIKGVSPESLSIIRENAQTLFATDDIGKKIVPLFKDLDTLSPLNRYLHTVFKNPQSFYRMLATSSTRENNLTDDTFSLTNGTINITSTLYTPSNYKSLDCKVRTDIYKAIPKLWNLPEASVTHETCIHNGDQECVYEIRWDDTNLTSPLQRFFAELMSNMFGTREQISQLQGSYDNLLEEYHKIEEKLYQEERTKEEIDMARLEEQKAREESERKSDIFRRYVRHSLVDRVDKGENPLDYPAEDIDTTILFSDIREFTKISEKLHNGEVSSFLNEYLHRMTTVIQETGEIDKYMGDSIMANFNKVTDAIDSAIRMKQSLREFNEESASDATTSPILANGIGLHYGPVTIGNIGSPVSRYDYTLIGDSVNIASRIEGLTKHYGAGILISESLINQIEEDDYEIREIDQVRVKGKDTPLRVFEVYDHEPEHIKIIKQQTYPYLRKAFDFYKNGDVKKANSIYSSLQKQLPPHKYKPNKTIDPVIDFLYARSKQILESGIHTSDKWNGVYIFRDK